MTVINYYLFVGEIVNAFTIKVCTNVPYIKIPNKKVQDGKGNEMACLQCLITRRNGRSYKKTREK